MATMTTHIPSPQRTKTCPRCAEELALTAETCPYCAAGFAVTRQGYCPTCRQVSYADPTAGCRMCGTALIDVQVESEPLTPAARVPTAFVPAPGPGEQTAFAMKVIGKLNRRKTGVWRGPIELALTGITVTVTGKYLDKETLARQKRRVLVPIVLLLGLLGVMVGSGMVMDASAKNSTTSDVAAAVFLVAVLLEILMFVIVMTGAVRARKDLKQAASRACVFPASAVTSLKLERYGSPGLLVVLLLLGGFLPGWLAWRFLFSRKRQLRITAPFDPDEPSVPETYRLVAHNKGEAAVVARALLPRGER